MITLISILFHIRSNVNKMVIGHMIDQESAEAGAALTTIAAVQFSGNKQSWCLARKICYMAVFSTSVAS